MNFKQWLESDYSHLIRYGFNAPQHARDAVDKTINRIDSIFPGFISALIGTPKRNYQSKFGRGEVETGGPIIFKDLIILRRKHPSTPGKAVHSGKGTKLYATLLQYASKDPYTVEGDIEGWTTSNLRHEIAHAIFEILGPIYSEWKKIWDQEKKVSGYSHKKRK